MVIPWETPERFEAGATIHTSCCRRKVAAST